MACAIIERTSGLEPSSETTAPRYLKLVTVANFCPFTLISLDAIGAVCHQFGLLRTDLGNISAAYANLPIMFFQDIGHDPFEKNVEEGG